MWRATAFVNFTRWIFRMSVHFRRIDFGGVMSWNTQPDCRASDDRRWDDLRPNFLSLLLSGFPYRSCLWSVTGPLSCQSPNFMIGPLKWFLKTSLMWGLPIRQEILNVSKIGIAFHGICPPIFFQTWLQQYGRGAFFHSAHCSFSNPICFRSVRCRRAMIPGKIFTSFAKFQGIVSVNDLRFLVGLQEFLQASLCSLWSFCSARIRLDSLGGQVLHHDCISVIVSRFAIVVEDLVICCDQITKIFSTRYGSAIASSARSPWNFGPLTDLTISVFRRSECKHCVYPNLHFSQAYSLKWFMRRTGVRVSVFRNSVIHKIFSEFLQSFRYVGF